MIKIQKNKFDIDELLEQLSKEGGNSVGAIATFTGLVREYDHPNQSPLTALELEHYPGMTEVALEKIVATAKLRFSLSAVILVHRVGRLSIGESIVFVATASEHRQSAFDACQFIMDYLKNDAPFWKKEFREDGSETWIEQKQSDVDATKQWQKKTAD